MSDFSSQVAGVAALGEPVRRDLYLYVAGAAQPVSREQAASALGVAPHTAKFHLDRLADEGLLTTEYRRLSGRRGPGAGRPTKLYRRSARELSVSVPPRHYDLAGRLMARAIERSSRDGAPVLDALHREAADLGRRLGEQATTAACDDPPQRPGGRGPATDAALLGVLAEHGFEPRLEAGAVTLVNCPFSALVQEHPALICGMSLALVAGIEDGLTAAAAASATAPGSPGSTAEGAPASTAERPGRRARLAPGPGRCCVVLAAEPGEPGEPGRPGQPADRPAG